MMQFPSSRNLLSLPGLFVFLMIAAGMAPGLVRAGDLFENSGDVGKPARPGSVIFDATATSCEMVGSGQNMWFTNDVFHFAWTRVDGDLSLQAAIEWSDAEGHAHRKACLIVRQSLEPDSACVYVAVHADGLTSLQFREAKGAMTREIQFDRKQSRRVGLTRQGETFFASAGPAKGPLQPVGAFMRIPFAGPVYVGLGVCSHDDKQIAKARFSQIALVRNPTTAGTNTVLHSSLETISIASKDRRVLLAMTNHFEAPNWSPDGSFLLFNMHGRIYRLPVKGGEPVAVDTGFANGCNNDHGISPDGKQLVISDQSQTRKSLIYVLPIEGGKPRQVTPLGPSYWHGWSPDGSTLAYCAERGGEYDVYTIPVTGGAERRLTTAKGLDDGPEYSPDGKWVYFNSDRTGTMQIWRIRPDGSGEEQVTKDNFNNWFAHPSPDGKWLVFISYEKEVTGHPANKKVWLRLLSTRGGEIQQLTRLFGGQGSINVPSWSPDSKNVAFVSYELLKRE